MVPVREPDESLQKEFGDGAPADICKAAATAAICDADMVVTENPEWFPFYNEFEKRDTLLGSARTGIREARP